ncbi:kelch-like ECH-associated protein 1 [Trichogramma pretiosum]|uniref:kelch-like ECH-associated protein 1 n=1 Tax=Trichogramma pretiosum TaxID=7493 RepID=UPI0006C952C2|nr:kelch-like ECH-associated protein 1 [Trichogramma pretiosum]
MFGANGSPTASSSRSSPRMRPRMSPRSSPRSSPRISPRMSPRTSPRSSPRMSPRSSPPTMSSRPSSPMASFQVYNSVKSPTPSDMKAAINGVPFPNGDGGCSWAQRPSAKDELKNAQFHDSARTNSFERHMPQNDATSMDVDPSSEPQGETMTFFKDTFATEVMKVMYTMRNNRMLTDVALEVGDKVLWAHKIVLAASSSYFTAMFTGGLKETNMTRVKLEGVCPSSMDQLIHFMYTGEVGVSDSTVCTLLCAAMMFQVTHVVDVCCLFLEKQLDPINAIGISNFAEKFSVWKLHESANQYIVHHFSSISQEEEFLQLSTRQLVQLVSSDELDVQEEKDVYNAVLKWVSYKEDDRSPLMESILHSVRCQYLTPNFLREQMKNCDLLKRMPSCKEYLAKIFKDLTLHVKPRVQRRTPKAKRIIFVAGGFHVHSLDTLEAYNVDDGTWTKLASLLLPRSGLGGLFLKGFFYAIGGRNNHPSNGGRFDNNLVDRYDPSTNSWRPCSPLSIARNRVSVAVMDDLIYAIGGSYNQEYHDSVEYYDPNSDAWNKIASMNTARLATGVAVVNRLMYAIGGFNGFQRLNTVECYHPENGRWSYVAPMKYARSGAGVASIGQYIYVAGGFNGTGQITSLERYDTETNTWEELSPLPFPRSALTLTAVDHLLYAIGGFDGSKFCEYCLIYDTKTDTWSQGMKMNEPKSGHASALFYQRCGHQCSHIDSISDALQASSSS